MIRYRYVVDLISPWGVPSRHVILPQAVTETGRLEPEEETRRRADEFVARKKDLGARVVEMTKEEVRYEDSQVGDGGPGD